MPLQVEMEWDEREWIRRLRRAERVVAASDIPQLKPMQPTRLAPKRNEPPQAKEAWVKKAIRLAAALQETAEATTISTTEDQLEGRVSFEDDRDQLTLNSDEEEECEADTAPDRGDWWNSAE